MKIEELEARLERDFALLRSPAYKSLDAIQTAFFSQVIEPEYRYTTVALSREKRREMLPLTIGRPRVVRSVSPSSRIRYLRLNLHRQMHLLHPLKRKYNPILSSTWFGFWMQWSLDLGIISWR